MSKKESTKLLHAGYDPKGYHGVVNPPIVRTSTLLYPSFEDFEGGNYKYDYGRNNTPLVETFTNTMAELEQGYGAVVGSSGLSAIVGSLLSVLKAGDHLLIADSLYGSSRRFCDYTLTRMGVETTYYDPLIGANIKNFIQDNTRVIFMESPGSSTFEVQDVPAIVKVAKEHGIVTMLDNSWSSSVLFKPLNHGVNISVLSCTKYINGHADGMLGVAIANDEKHYALLKKSFKAMGVCAGSEEVNLGIRGLKTLHVRMKEAGERGLKIAKWLESRDEVTKVYYPALESHSSHEIWKRDFEGANGILSIQLKPSSKDALKAFLQALEYFPIGDSWGGYESLCQPQHTILKSRVAVPWTQDGWLVRLQIGLEDPEDLMADLEQAFKKFGEKA